MLSRKDSIGEMVTKIKYLLSYMLNQIESKVLLI